MFHSATTFFKNLDLGQGLKKSSQRHGSARSSVPRLGQVLCATAVPGPLCHGCAVASHFPILFLSIFLVMAIFVT